MPTETMIGVEALLGQERWVRRLARALVQDEDEAEDVIQETRVASWRRPPRDPERARSWLGTVVRNVVRNRRRAEGARQRLEGELESADPVPSAERLAERLEIHRALAEAVSRLDEPFRQVVLLRYYEELSSAEIARRLNEPPGTIRWRLKTGLDRLRAELDERRGRGAWLAALAPLAGGEDRTPVAGRPSLVWPAVVIALGVAGAAGTFVWRHAREAAVTLGTAAARGTFEAGRARPLARPFALGAPAPAAAPEEVPAWVQLEGVPPQTIAGRVVSLGRPVAGAHLRLSSGTLTSARGLDRHATSSADGSFAFPGQPITDWFLTASAPGLQPVIHYLDLRQANAGSRVDGHPVDALVIDLMPCQVVARGIVRDAGGGAIAAARVRAGAGGVGGVEAQTDGYGAYELCVPPVSPHTRLLTAEASGYGAVVALAPGESRTVDFVLAPQSIVAGRAIDKARGGPAAGVHVLLRLVTPFDPAQPPAERRLPSPREGRTDEAGRFELTGVAPGRYTLHFASDALFGAAAGDLTIAPGEQRRGLEVALSPVAIIDGTVARQGSPAAGVDLRFTPTAGGAGPRRTRSDERGHFRVRLPQDLPHVIETPAEPGQPEGRWVPVPTPAVVAGEPQVRGLAVELPSSTTADLGSFVTPPGGTAPPPGHVLEGRFGDEVRLLGYDVGGDRVGRGGQLEVTLHFQVLAPLEGVRMFSHLVGPSGFTNLDHAPAQGRHPVARWRAGETIRDRFSIAVPPTFAPGVYTLLVGFWRSAGNQRLAVRPPERDDGQRRFSVLTFTVE